MLFLALVMISCQTGEDKSELREVDPILLNSEEPKLDKLLNAIEDEPDNAQLIYKRSKVYYDYRYFYKALKDINQAIKIDSKNPEYYLLKSKILRNLENYKDAEVMARKSIDLGSKNPDVYILLAELYALLGNNSLADDFTQKATQYAAHHPEVYYLQAKQSLRNGDTTSALFKLKESIGKKTSYSQPYASIAEIYYNKGYNDSAMIYIVQGLKNVPDKAPLYFYNGKVMERTGLKDAALMLYESAANEDSTYLPVYALLGNYYFENNQKNKAQGYLNNYVGYSNSNRKVNLMLGELAESRGQGKEAIKYFEDALVLDTTDKILKVKLDNLYLQYAPKEKESVKNITLQDTVVSQAKPGETKVQPEVVSKPLQEVKKDSIVSSKTTKPVVTKSKPAKNKVVKDSVPKVTPVAEPEVETVVEPKPVEVETPPAQLEPVAPVEEDTATKKKKKNKKASKGVQ